MSTSQGSTPGRSFAANMSIVLAGAAAGHVLSLLALPLIARIYSPASFGEFAIYLAVVQVLLPFSTLRYELAVPLAETGTERRGLLMIVLATSIAFGTVLVLVSGTLAGVLENSIGLSGGTLRTLPLAVVLGAAFSVLSYLAIASSDFVGLSGGRVSRSAAGATAQVGLGVASRASPIALVAGDIVGRAVGVAALGVACRSSLRGKWPSWSVARRVAWRHRDFARFSTFSGAVNAAGHAIPIVAISSFFGEAAAGLFALATRILLGVVSAVSQAAAQAFYPRIAGGSRQEVRRGVVGVVNGFAPLVAGPLVSICLAGPLLFATAFGEEWYVAGEYAQFLAPWLAVVFVVAPLTPVVFVLGGQSKELGFQVVLVASRIGALAIGISVSSMTVTVIAVGSAALVAWLGFGIYIFRAAGASLPEMRDGVVRAASAATIVGMSIAVAQAAFAESSVVVVVAVVAPLLSVARQLWRLRMQPAVG